MTTTGHMTMTDLCISDTCTCFPPSVSNAFVSVLAALAIASPNSPDSLSRHQQHDRIKPKVARAVDC